MPRRPIPDHKLVLVRQSFNAPIQGARLEADKCTKAGMWLLSGNGRTSEKGKDTFSLQSKVCFNELTTFPAEELTPQPSPAQTGYLSYVIVGAFNFIATPADGQPFLLTTSAEVADVPLAPDSPIIVNFDGDPMEGSNTTEKDVVITVHSFGLDGREAGPVFYYWMCIVEVGVTFYPPP